MSEKNETVQMEIGDRLKGVLSGDMLANALDFTDYLKEIGMTCDIEDSKK